VDLLLPKTYWARNRGLSRVWTWNAYSAVVGGRRGVAFVNFALSEKCRIMFLSEYHCPKGKIWGWKPTFWRNLEAKLKFRAAISHLSENCNFLPGYFLTHDDTAKYVHGGWKETWWRSALNAGSDSVDRAASMSRSSFHRWRTSKHSAHLLHLCLLMNNTFEAHLYGKTINEP